VGNPEASKTKALIRTLWKNHHPRQVSAISASPPQEGSPALLKDGPSVNGEPAAYVCQGFVCLQPTNEPSEMETQLEANSAK
jgi:uncharacterized protein YyaL (SSP411 family)